MNTLIFLIILLYKFYVTLSHFVHSLVRLNHSYPKKMQSIINFSLSTSLYNFIQVVVQLRSITG